MTTLSPAPTGPIVEEWVEADLLFQIEKLLCPKMQGAGARPYRLWVNGAPSEGGQWCYDLEHARGNARYRVAQRKGYRLSHLEDRINLMAHKVRQAEATEAKLVATQAALDTLLERLRTVHSAPWWRRVWWALWNEEV